MTDAIPPRSCLSVPGTDDRKIRKAWDSEADEVVLDLEDAVQVARKDEARGMLGTLPPRTTGKVGRRGGEGAVGVARRAAARGRLGTPRARTTGKVAIRVNAPRAAWCHLDVSASAGLAGLPESIVLPKVASAGDLEFVDRLLDGVEAATERGRPIGVQALIETAKGVANLREIVTASPRLSALILGYADLGASLGRTADSWSYP